MVAERIAASVVRPLVEQLEHLEAVELVAELVVELFAKLFAKLVAAAMKAVDSSGQFLPIHRLVYEADREESSAFGLALGSALRRAKTSAQSSHESTQSYPAQSSPDSCLLIAVV